MVLSTTTNQNLISFRVKLTISQIILIAIIHIIGFYSLKTWYEFSGVGNDALKLKQDYGDLAYYGLNFFAAILFVLIAMIYKFGFESNNRRITNSISLVFSLRGIIGILATLIGRTGTASSFWEIVFSFYSLLIGILAYRGRKFK